MTNEGESHSGVRLVFDTGSLTYTCLKGCMYMLHKSMLHFPVIIKNTLSDGTLQCQALHQEVRQ